MAFQMPMKFEKICRTCMTDKNIFHSLFDYVDVDYGNDKVQICELLSTTVPKLPKIEIISDKLPKNICSNCVKKVQMFSEFENCCFNSDLQLRKLCNNTLASVDEVAEQPDPLNENALHFEIKEEFTEDFEKSELMMLVDEAPISGTVDTDFLADSEVDSEYDPEYIPDTETKTGNAAPNTKEKTRCYCSVCEKFFSCRRSLSNHNRNIHKIYRQKSKVKTKKTKLQVKIVKQNADEINGMKGESVKNTESESPVCSSNNECNPSEISITPKNEDKFNFHAKIKSCELCDQTYKTTTKLLEHYNNVHPERLESNDLPVPEAIKCVYCPYCKKGMKHVTEHLRLHTKERPFLCPHCGKGYSSSTSLKQHMLRHTGEKRYACTECPKRFTCQSDLCKHRHIHKKIKPHVCDICGNSFKRSDELTMHKRTHEERKFRCEHCGKDFNAKKHLTRHMLTHTGEKPYKCKYCPNKSFSQSNDMIKHLRIHLGDNVYQCELCPAAFPKAGERRIHFATHINDDEEIRERNKLALNEAQEKLSQKLQLGNTTVGKKRVENET